jgi:hypothetical protein
MYDHDSPFEIKRKMSELLIKVIVATHVQRSHYFEIRGRGDFSLRC